MKKLQKFFALTAIMTMVASSGFSQEYYDEGVAYDDSSNVSRMAVLLPVGALVVAAILIAATDHHHHHHHSSTTTNTHAHSH